MAVGDCIWVTASGALSGIGGGLAPLVVPEAPNLRPDSPTDQRVIRMWPRGAANLWVTSGPQPPIIPCGPWRRPSPWAVGWGSKQWPEAQPAGRTKAPSLVGRANGEGQTLSLHWACSFLSFFCFWGAPGGAGMQFPAQSSGVVPGGASETGKRRGLEPGGPACND